MVKVKDILEAVNTIAPFDIAEEWDNSGLQAGSTGFEVKKVLIGLDVSLDLMNAAKKGNYDLVLTHHPLIFHPQKSIDFSKMPGSAIKIAANHSINIVAAHTNLDKASNGLNDYFANTIGVKKTEIFDETTGIGRIGSLQSRTLLKQLTTQLKEKLGLTHLRVTGDMDLPVNSVALCTGSGGSLVSEFLRSKADVYITGDIKYHEARCVEQYSKALVDVGHFASEQIAVDLLFDILSQAKKKAGLNIEIKKFKKEKDPFTIV